jgi:asparagine synthetase B (glutamine-hydrolysing)
VPSKCWGKFIYGEMTTIKINDNLITSFLTFRHLIGDLSEFDGSKIKWLKKEPRFEEKDIQFEEAENKIEEILINEIKKLENKEIAVVLSGGLDSSMILALCRKVFPEKRIHTYTAGFYGENEFKYARLVSKKFDSIHTERLIKKEDYIGEKSLLKPLVRSKKEPLHPNEIALAKVESVAKKDGCDVIVCGEGADDIFGGYGQNFRMYMNYDGSEPFFKFFLRNYRYFSIDARKKIVKDEFLIDDYELLMKYLDNIPDDVKNKVFYFTQKIHTPGLLKRAINAMEFNNLEPNFPYLCEELVEFVNSLSFDYKVRWKSEEHRKKAQNMYFREISEKMDIPKYILKKMAEKYLPHKIIYRPKYAFPVPFDKWFKYLEYWPLNQEIFKTNKISGFNGWEKFMLINLNTFIEEFGEYER